MSHTPITIRLFGPPEIRVYGEPLPRLKTRKGLYILALLTLRHNREVERSWLAGMLWPENDETTALTYLRQSLSDLRGALGDASTCLLSPSSRTLRLAGDGAVESDFITFQQCLTRGGTSALEQAVALYRGSLLEGWAEDWLLADRAFSAQSYLSALETLAREALSAGESAAAIPFLRRIVAADPLRESACRSLMQALATTRDYAAVTQVYRELRIALRRDAQVEPVAETQALFSRLRAEARRLASLAPSPETGANDRHTPDSEPVSERGAPGLLSLPNPLTEFIGRAREVEAARHALRASRLVTLTGIGGVGKTRLALRVATEAADDFPDGVRFVDLSPLTDPALVAKTAAIALNIAEQAGRSLTQTICEHLRERHLLLILDNCEHLTEECAHFASALISQCPNVRILATSRQRLGITGEMLWRVPPMALPDPKHRDDDKNTAALLEYEAVRLFVDRAYKVQPDLTLNEATLRSVAVICRRLDGIPLALELAAARMSVLGAEQIAARLTERFRLLSRRDRAGDDRSSPTRQRTLKAALDWSYDLLLPEEQILLCRVSVFVGGWTLEAAEAVCAGNGLDENDILDSLTGLAEHSLIVVESESGRARYRLLETVREYAQEHLRAQKDAYGEDLVVALRAKHRDYFLRMAEEASALMMRPAQAEWLNRLDTEHDNLRVVLEGCTAENTGDTGLRLAAALGLFWKIRGHYREGKAWLERFLAVPIATENREQKETRGEALYWLGTIDHDMGDFAAAHRCLEQCAAVFREIGSEKGVASAVSNQGNIAYRMGDYPLARRLYGEALEYYQRESQTSGIASMLGSLGNVEQAEGNLAESRRLQEESLRLSREVGDARMSSYTLHNLGRLATLEKNLARARVFYEESLALKRTLGDRRGVASLVNNLAFLALEEGKAAEAGTLLVEALQTLLEMGSRLDLVMSLVGMGRHAWLQGDPERAARLWGAALDAAKRMGIASYESDEGYARVVAEARAISPTTFDAAWAEGSTLTLEDAAHYALAQWDARSPYIPTG